ncbi:chromate efflux transporter [Saccharophagus degradans]|uniref:Chromate efflux transporter n=1 Tax=Saccharophagus degradans TaxID=86304 RepID=A0AAW7XE60_9GAMM|nr:chromate efflux transporter [Saccharophagus degradans]MBU2986517.1 chromate efflux transporter [Saccharophagus degradans]MDO6424707.1 chromate efflux transporter [Saccharophagus degradans]MDO6609541.1 chromate efflux transporter [Saccharophagus degradans]
MKQGFEVFWRFLLLGFVSFGGPAAHIGYFRNAFVEKRQWLTEEAFARLLALSQFLPGPGSSQLGFAIGLQRAGLAGGIAAFLGFTLPSFLLMYFIAVINVDEHTQGELGTTVRAVLQGLKLLAVVVVADAALSMFKTFCKTRLAVAIALATAIALLMAPTLWMQMAVLITAALVGCVWGKPAPQAAVPSSGFKLVPLSLFAALFIGLPIAATQFNQIQFFADFYQAGSLVFGGGHVVLPLLQQTVGSAISPDQFLTGYAAAQAVPGPMFTFATFLGAELAVLSSLSPIQGALLATLAIFLPGFLLVLSLQGAWQNLASKPKIAGAAWGINAAVVGLLIAALYNPVFISAVFSPKDMAMILAGLFALRVMRVPIVYLVVGFGVVRIWL